MDGAARLWSGGSLGYNRAARGPRDQDQEPMAKKFFGTDGIRGRANSHITPELALKVGQAAGQTIDVAAHDGAEVGVDDRGRQTLELPEFGGDEVGDAARAAQTFRDKLVQMEKMEAEQREAELHAAAEKKAAAILKTFAKR